ncbi:MAG: hypothetical protein P1U83_05720 [Roseovarius sp.]|nr:hypothetical protein [Roseovarius sp.]
MSDEVLAEIRASAPRRGLGISMLGALGVMLIYIALVAPPADFWAQLMLIAFGLGSLWMAEKMRRATLLRLELTMQELRTSDGKVLARADQFVSIDRGAFALKPSHGFTLKLSEKSPAGWQPGMYWRFGKRLGVGGVTPGAQTKVMSDMIAAMIMERQPG